MMTLRCRFSLLWTTLLYCFSPPKQGYKTSRSQNLTASRFLSLLQLETPSPPHSVDLGLVLPCFFRLPLPSAPFRCGVGSYKVTSGGS